jgi:hypothetical protein
LRKRVYEPPGASFFRRLEEELRPETKFLGGETCWALRNVKQSFGEEFRYHRRVKSDWKQEDIEKA